MRAGSQAEDWRAGAIGALDPLELGLEPATGAVVDHRVGGAEHDPKRQRARVGQRFIPVHADRSGPQPVLGEHVEQQPGRDVVTELQHRDGVA